MQSCPNPKSISGFNSMGFNSVDITKLDKEMDATKRVLYLQHKMVKCAVEEDNAEYLISN